MRLHQEIGISVSDDTVYRSMKGLGFSHVSADLSPQNWIVFG